MKKTKAALRQFEADLLRGWLLSGQPEDSKVFPLVVKACLKHRAELEKLAGEFVTRLRETLGEKTIEEIRDAAEKHLNKKPRRKPPAIPKAKSLQTFLKVVR